LTEKMVEMEQKSKDLLRLINENIDKIERSVGMARTQKPKKIASSKRAAILDDLLELVEEGKDKKVEGSDSVKALTDELYSELEKRASASSGIVRDGSKINVPEFMTLKDAAVSIMHWETSMEEDTQKQTIWTGHEDDMLVAFQRGVKKAFGQVAGKSVTEWSFFGPRKIPGQSMTVPIDHGKKMSVLYGNVEIPGLPIQMSVGTKRNRADAMQSNMVVVFSYKKKLEPLVEKIEACVTEELDGNSIFKAKAINSRFEFIDTKSPAVEKLVYSEQEERDLNTHMFQPIRASEQLEKRGMSLKRTVLLHGKFGTGKTLTALRAAQVCLDNGWTFMNVLPGDDVTTALEFARRYEPSLVFFEDIDQVAVKERTSAVNEILNTVDGLLSKTSKVLTILTTNRTDRIQKAMLRPGRIDAVIEMGRIDAKAMKGMVEAYCGDALDGPLNIEKLLVDGKEYTPSFIAEACNRSLLYAMSRNGNSADNVRVTSSDLSSALKGLRSQFDLMNTTIDEESTMESKMQDLVKKQVADATADMHSTVQDVEDGISEIKDILS